MNCRLCTTQTRTIIHPVRGVYHLCPRCELISLDAALHPSEDEAFKEYCLHENSSEDPRYVAYFRSFIEEAVLPFAPKGRTALDFGSGPSPVLATLLDGQYGYRTDCYDLFFSPEKVYLGRSYDLITSTEVIEHIGDPLSLFKLFAHLLAPGGVLSVMTLLHPRDEGKFLSWHYIRERSHITFYSRETLGRLALSCGLSLLYCDGIQLACFGKDACP
ncbi:MAG: class I SAM-dependent methyltransferase [Sphaerochaeta sp.]|nr:class I SAM-dependent methyltransferase [Sphaerochaeta sp.]